MSNVYSNKAFVCIEFSGDNQCTAWQQTNLGVITPELAGIILTYAFLLNLVVFGFRTMKRQF